MLQKIEEFIREVYNYYRSAMNNRMKREATYRLETINDHVRTRAEVRDDDISNGSARREVHIPRSKPRWQHTWEMRHQGRVKRGHGEGEEGRKSNGRADEKVAVTRGPGMCAMDQTVNGVSLIKPMSSQEDVPGTQLNTPSPPPPTPILLFKQLAPTSKRPTDQRR
ncbi:hypothetical protein PAXINDRAFT_18225 [Paxillus involutus ATCC 200175]|uniref:Uncharacterized protein n=1 Tax=Paxillus involutus ATCC 200175 TaxID=664439 RepID=A0A0C9TN71_PAXIN|nr:hypothetical protein PAXINDRAFT_18225 [Paxillus involutus ATCC 200175]